MNPYTLLSITQTATELDGTSTGISCSIGVFFFLPCIDAHGCEVQRVLGLEEKRLGPDLQDGWSLQRGGDDKQGQLRGVHGPIIRDLVLPMEVLETPAEIQRLNVCTHE